MSDLEPRVIVKIRREGFSIPYQDSAELMLTGLAADAWQQMATAFPETRLSLNRILTAQTPEQLLGPNPTLKP
jgi:hypothetical protein